MKETVDKDRSFAYFVYPFLFNVTPEDRTSFESLSRQIDAASLNGKTVWQKRPFSTADLMPHVGGFLNPTDTESLSNQTLTARLWKEMDILA